MGRPQLSLRSFLLASSFLGAGTGCLLIGVLWAMSPFPTWGSPSLPLSENPWLMLLPLMQLLVGGPLIGAGIMLPFRRARIGAYIGFFVGVVILFEVIRRH